MVPSGPPSQIMPRRCRELSALTWFGGRDCMPAGETGDTGLASRSVGLQLYGPCWSYTKLHKP